MAGQLADSDVEMIVTDPQIEGIVEEALKKLKKTMPVFVNGASSRGHANIQDLLNDPNRPFCELVEVRGKGKGCRESEGGKGKADKGWIEGGREERK